jgi:hypothetical protein
MASSGGRADGHRSLKTQAFIDRCQVDIVDLTGSYVRNPGINKWATIFDGAEPCRVEEFAARYFRRSGFDASYFRRIGL